MSSSIKSRYQAPIIISTQKYFQVDPARAARLFTVSSVLSWKCLPVQKLNIKQQTNVSTFYYTVYFTFLL